MHACVKSRHSTRLACADARMRACMCACNHVMQAETTGMRFLWVAQPRRDAQPSAITAEVRGSAAMQRMPCAPCVWAQPLHVTLSMQGPPSARRYGSVESFGPQQSPCSSLLPRPAGAGVRGRTLWRRVAHPRRRVLRVLPLLLQAHRVHLPVLAAVLHQEHAHRGAPAVRQAGGRLVHPL